MTLDVSRQFQALVDAARTISSDVQESVRQILSLGLDQPLPRDEARTLLLRVVEAVRTGAQARGDDAAAAALASDVEAFVERVLAERDQIRAARVPDPSRHIALQGHDGIEPQAVRPNPRFHQREVPVRQGFVRASDISLWGENERIDIHCNQFKLLHGRDPGPEDLLEIMLGNSQATGVEDEDQFEIRALAQSIAANGVRRPPIIDLDGTLLDGNRRLTACHLILSSEAFDSVEKRRAEWIQVWQLTEHATRADREAVIVSLNFEPDYKQQWPEYVKARRVHGDWQAALALEPKADGVRQREIKQEIARRFALEVTSVTRYIDMVEVADEFEDFHVTSHKRDRFEVKHRAERYFQYFAELARGKNPGGVNHTLNQDEPFKELVFDLLFEGKFRNWAKIRDLRYVANNDEAMAFLVEARTTKDQKKALDLVDDGLSSARTAKASARSVSGNKRIEVFVKWLEDAPVKIFAPGSPDSITPQNLGALYRALKLVEGYLPKPPDADRAEAGA